MRSVVAGSRPLVGSSSITIFGLCSIALANDSRCLMPFDRSETFRFRTSDNPDSVKQIQNHFALIFNRIDICEHFEIIETGQPFVKTVAVQNAAERRINASVIFTGILSENRHFSFAIISKPQNNFYQRGFPSSRRPEKPENLTPSRT